MDVKRSLRRVPGLLQGVRQVRRVAQYATYLDHYSRYRQLTQGKPQRFALSWSRRLVVLGEWSNQHAFDRHYVYHPAWAARIVAALKPDHHVDISSSLHFSTILSAFVPVHYYEYRALELGLDGLECGSADLFSLPFESDSVPSLSCMHVVEHIGLGRYGDPIDPDGDLKAMTELRRVLAPGGSLLFVVPTGKPALYFNGHRVYRFRQVVEAFAGLALREFALIPDRPDDGGLVHHASEELADRQEFGCGCYWFVK